jgi:hypothetical protein
LFPILDFSLPAKVSTSSSLELRRGGVNVGGGVRTHNGVLRFRNPLLQG